MSESGTSRTWVDSVFYTDGPACENEGSPNLVLSRGSGYADVDEDRRSERDCLAAASCTVFFRQAGHLPV